MTRDEEMMNLALDAARVAASEDEVPVGAIVVRNGAVIGTGHNQRETLQSPLCHAEITAIEQAAKHLCSWRLSECEIYVTLEPCIMCVGAILQARLRRLVFGCADPKAGAVESLYRLCEDRRLNHQLPVVSGVLADPSAALLSEFFSSLRARKRANPRGEVAEPG